MRIRAEECRVATPSERHSLPHCANMHSSQPSTVLPALAPTSPPPAALALSIDHLNALLFPAQPIIDLRVPLAPIHSEDHDSTMLDQDEAGQDDEVGMDAFEVDFARDWLNRVVAIGTRRCARGEDEMTGAWEGVIDRAAKLLTDLSGPGGQFERLPLSFLSRVVLMQGIRNSSRRLDEDVYLAPSPSANQTRIAGPCSSARRVVVLSHSATNSTALRHGRAR